MDAVFAIYPIAERMQSRFLREARVLTMDGPVQLSKVTLDTGANSGNYVGQDFFNRLSGVNSTKCQHDVRLGDGQSKMRIKEKVSLQIQLLKDDSFYTEPIHLQFYIVPSLGEEAIIGAPTLLSDCFLYFLEVLDAETTLGANLSHRHAADLERLSLDVGLELQRNPPRRTVLERLVKESERLGKAYRKDRALMPVPLFNIESVSPLVGEILEPWRDAVTLCPEEELTPDPVSFMSDMLRFMELSVEDSRREYLSMLDDHVSEGMKGSCPEVMELLRSGLAQDVFAPSRWDGIKVEPVTMQINGQLPPRMFTRARPLRAELYDCAKKEFERLRRYFYEESESPIASPLVIAPKSTAPYIRFCGDYRKINEFIVIPQQPIPIVQHELVKAAKYCYFVDLDMANSFHQIP